MKGVGTMMGVLEVDDAASDTDEEALEAGVDEDTRDSEICEGRSLPLEAVCTVLPALLSGGCEIVEEVLWLVTVDELIAWLSEDEEGEGDNDGEDDKEDVGGCWLLDDEMLLMDSANVDADEEVSMASGSLVAAV